MVELLWQDGSGVLVVYDVDALAVPLIERAVTIAASCQADIVIDLRPCRYFGACGIGMLVRLEKLFPHRIILLVVSGGMVGRILRITGLRDALTVLSFDRHYSATEIVALLKKANDPSAPASIRLQNRILPGVESVQRGAFASFSLN